MDKTGREIVLRENVKFFFAHVTNSYHPHERRYELDARTRGDVRTEDENFRLISVERVF